MNWIDLCEIVLCWWILSCELLCHIWLSWGACHSWLCMLVIVVDVVELYADIHSFESIAYSYIVEGSCRGMFIIQNVEGSCPGMPCHSNALNGTTCMCIVALSLFVVVSLHSRSRWLSCCCVVVVGWIWICW